MIEYADETVRAAQLEKMVNIEDLIWMQIGKHDKVWSIADEDLERSNDTKTSAVHFLRFEVSDEMAQELKAGADWQIGVQHAVYTYHLLIEGDTRSSLLNDLDQED
jgi:hypothetical protein